LPTTPAIVRDTQHSSRPQAGGSCRLDQETVPSLLGFAAIQGVERQQKLTDLAPKGGFIAAEAVERATVRILAYGFLIRRV
jgi:hypothetical protein